MKFRYFLFALLFTCLSLFSQKTFAQDDCCGIGSLFGSLLRSGISGGYGIQQYSAEGWNNYISVYNQNRVSTLTKQMDDFGSAKGFRIGANLLQIQTDQVLVGFKFFFQRMTEENEATADISAGTARREYELNMNTWAIGGSVSYVVSKYFDIKIADLMVTFTSTELKNREIFPNQPVSEQILESPETSTGFIFGSGVVFYPLPPYISIELNGGYSLFSVDEMEFENGARLSVDENSNEVMTNFIDGGGFFAFAQLNVGIPF